jgi:hypothetical protein
MGERKGAYMVLVRRPEGRMPLEIPKLDGRIILKWSFKMWVGNMDWIDLAQDRNRRRALVNEVTILRVP